MAGDVVGLKTLSGICYDVLGNPCSTVVRAYRRDTGEMVGEATSRPITGDYTITTAYQGKCTLVFLPPTTGNGLNALVLDDMLPV